MTLDHAFKIEKNVPPPPPTNPFCSRNSYYPFYAMVPGDSFLVPQGENGTIQQVAQRVRWAVKRYQRQRPAWRFRTKSTNKGVRVWRVE